MPQSQDSQQMSLLKISNKRNLSILMQMKTIMTGNINVIMAFHRNMA